MSGKTQSVLSFAAAAIALALVPINAAAQTTCAATPVASGLARPIGLVQSNQGNLLVSESGTSTPNTGRISIVDVAGHRNTFIDGLPSGISDVGDPSGPSGLYLRGRTLYLVIGSGDTVFAGAIPNPNPSSPLFSSVLAIHFSAGVEKKALHGFMLTAEDTQAIAGGSRVTLTNIDGQQITIELLVNFPDYTIDATSPSGFRNVTPFTSLAIGDQLYVSDGGQNKIWRVDLPTATYSVLVAFPRIPNPLPGPPLIEAVPTGLAYADGQLLVALFRGFPFPVGSSVVEQVDPVTGVHSPLITGLKTAIAVLPLREGAGTDYLVLQHASRPGPPPSPASQPGLVLRFDAQGHPPTILADCLMRPTAMTLDEKSDMLYVTEYSTGRLVVIPMR